MKLRLRKRIKIAPGVYVNIGSKGVSSVSVGGKGTTVNVGQRGVTATQSIPGTGVSVSQTSGWPRVAAQERQQTSEFERQDGGTRGYVIIAGWVLLAATIAVCT